MGIVEAFMRTFILAIALLAPTSARAEVLLMELHHYVGSGSNSCGSTSDITSGCANLYLQASGGGNDGNFFDRFLASEVGVTKALNDSSQLAGFDAALKLPDSRLEFSTAGSSGAGVLLFKPDQLWDDSI